LLYINIVSKLKLKNEIVIYTTPDREETITTNSASGQLISSQYLADNALVALTLLITESQAEEKDTIAKVIVNLINQNN